MTIETMQQESSRSGPRSINQSKSNPNTPTITRSMSSILPDQGKLAPRFSLSHTDAITDKNNVEDSSAEAFWPVNDGDQTRMNQPDSPSIDKHWVDRIAAGFYDLRMEARLSGWMSLKVDEIRACSLYQSVNQLASQQVNKHDLAMVMSLARPEQIYRSKSC